MQGLGAELVLALFLYRAYRLPVVVLAGAAAGLALGINDTVLWYPGLDAAFKTVYVVSAVVSGAVIAGLGRGCSCGRSPRPACCPRSPRT